MGRYNNEIDDWAWGNFYQLLEDGKKREAELNAEKQKHKDKKKWSDSHYKAGDGRWYKL